MCLCIRILLCEWVWCVSEATVNIHLLYYCVIINTVQVEVHMVAWYMLRSLLCLKGWYVLLWVLIWVCWGVTQNPLLMISAFGEGQWQGFRPQLHALCVNTASETWPQLIQLMTQRGRWGRRLNRTLEEAWRDEETDYWRWDTCHSSQHDLIYALFKPQYYLNKTKL